jgi:hypothetical protein
MKGRLITPFLIAISLLVALLVLLHTPALSETDVTKCVNTTGSDGCYTSIQAAINAASPHDRINVDVGTYYEHITVTKNLELFGKGWDYTVIDGGYSQSWPVVTLNEFIIDASTIISGFKITGGGDGNPDDLDTQGGGIYIPAGSPRIINTFVYSCTARNGGGIFVGNSSPSFDNVPVWNSRAAQEGGGIYIQGTGSITITGNPFASWNNGTIWWNHAEWGGGGISIWDAKVFISGMRLYWNSTDQYGGGVKIESDPNLVRMLFNDISGNTADNGGGIQAAQADNLDISANFIGSSNFLIGGNSAKNVGGGAYFNSASGKFQTNWVYGNVANHFGGIFLINPSTTLLVSRNRIEANHGSGLAIIYNATPLVDSNTIIANTAGIGGGIYIYDSDNFSITNNIIAGNIVTGSGLGGGIAFDESAPRLINNTIAANTGDGVYFHATQGAEMVNNIISLNSGHGIDWYELPFTTTWYLINYNDVYLNSGGDYTPNITPGSYEVSLDPLFIGTGSDAFTYFHIQDNSPVKSTGSLANAPKYDIDGQNRWLNGKVSMGADEIEYEVFLPLTMRQNP